MVNDRMSLFHVIYFKHGVSNIKVSDENENVQYRYNMKGEVERIYERLPCPMMGNANQLQATSGLSVGMVVDSVLMQNLILLAKCSTHTLLGKSVKHYLENVVHLTGVNVYFLFSPMVRVEKNFSVAIKGFVKNIVNCLKQFLFVKQQTTKRGESASVSECPYGALCKFKQYKQKFESFKNYTSVHYALCSSLGAEKVAPIHATVFRFKEFVNLITTNETRAIFDHVMSIVERI